MDSLSRPNLSLSVSPFPSQRRLAKLAAATKLYIGPLAILVLTSWLLYNFAQTIMRVQSFYTPLPIWDYWRVVENLPEYKSFHIGVLWRQHNEHRIIFPEIVFASDLLLWHGCQILPLIANFVCYAGTWLVLSWALIADRHVAGWCKAVAVMLAGIIALWEGAALVLAAPFLLQWPMMQLGVAVALTCLSRMRELNPRYVFGVIAGAVVATYSSGNGLLLWPLLLICAAALRIDRRRFVILGAAGAIAVGLYFVGYNHSSHQHLSLLDLASHPLYVLGFVASYVSMPFGGIGAGQSSFIAGGVSLAGIACVAWIAARRGRLRDHASIVLLGFLGFTLLTACVTAWGRMSLTDATFGAAKAVRYLAVPLMNWSAFVLATLWLAARCSRRSFFAVLSLAMAVCLFFWLPKLEPWVAQNSKPFSEAQLATLSLDDHQMDSELALGHVFPDRRVLQTLSDRLKHEKLSIYYQGHDKWLGRPAAEFARPRPSLSGAIVTAYPTASGTLVVGWADDSRLRLRYTWVVLTDEAGTIQGFGRRFEAGFPDSALVPQLPASLAWAAYVPSSLRGKKILAYVLDRRKRGLMPLEGTLRIPQIEAVDAQSARGVLPDVRWVSQVQGKPDILPQSDFGKPPAGEVQSTFGGADSFIGTVHSSNFARPVNGCLMLPLLNGPSIAGLSARIEDARSGTTVENLPLRGLRSSWHYWRVRVGPETRELRVVIEDRGRDWGQWIAVAPPLACE